jgi:hypothetical protein
MKSIPTSRLPGLVLAFCILVLSFLLFSTQISTPTLTVRIGTCSVISFLLIKMSKRTTFTTISPLPHGISRETVIEFLHDYTEMIDLNPLVRERHQIRPPPHASPEEFHCTWYSLTDKISYLPGGLVKGDVTYTCAFHDLPNGLQTHCYAPAGLSKVS